MTLDPRIWVVGPMSAELRGEYIRPETAKALEDYQHFSHRGARLKAKHYAAEYARLYREDVEAAVSRSTITL